MIADPQGNLYFSNSSGNQVDEYAASTHSQWGISMTAGDVYLILGSSSGSSGTTLGARASTLLDWPTGLFVDANGDLIVTDNGNSRILELAATSHTQWGVSMTQNDVYTVAGQSDGDGGGSGLGGPATSAYLYVPGAIPIDSAGDLYIADVGNQHVDEVPATSGTQWGQQMTADDIYTVAGAPSWDQGHTADGAPGTSSLLSGPEDVALDAQGDVFISDTGNNRVVEMPVASGTQFGIPMTAGDLYTVAGSPVGTSGLSGEGGPGRAAEIDNPQGIAVDASGDVYIADYNNNRVVELAAHSGTQWGASMTAGHLYTVAGSPQGNWGHTDGVSGTSAQILWPGGVGLDSAGDLYVASAGYNIVRELLSPSGAASLPGPTLPVDYGLLSQTISGNAVSDVFAHRVRSGESSVPITYPASLNSAAALEVYSGVATAGTLDTSSSATTASGTTVSPASITTSDPGDEVVLAAGSLGGSSAQSWSVSSGLTSEAQADSTVGISSLLADEPGPQVPGSVASATATASVSGALGASLVALEPATVTSTTLYDADDEAVLATNPDGNATLICHDPDGNVVETVPAVGVAEEALSAGSCAASKLYPSGAVNSSGTEVMPLPLAPDATTTSYDGDGYAVSVTTPAPSGANYQVSTANSSFNYDYEQTTNTYDGASQLLTTSAPPASNDSGAPNQLTAYTYDENGQVTSETTGAGTSAASTTVYCYDPNGDETAVVAPDGSTSGVAVCSTSTPYDTSSPYQTTYAYDSAGELISQTTPVTSANPSGGATLYTYDDAGNELTSYDPDEITTTNTYTPLGKLASVSYSGSSAHSVSYSYDANGNLTQMVDASGTSTYTYDPFGELTSVENGAGKTVSYGYNSLGEETSITYPLGSGATWATTDTVNNGFDAAGRLTSVSDFEGNTISIASSADGLPTSEALGASGDTISTSYDASDAPSAIDLQNGSTTLLGFSYSRTPSGNVGAETDTPSHSDEPQDYDYSAESRITSDELGSSGTLTYTEDASGNLTTLPTGGSASYNDERADLVHLVRHDDELFVQQRWRADSGEAGGDHDGDGPVQRCRRADELRRRRGGSLLSDL